MVTAFICTHTVFVIRIYILDYLRKTLLLILIELGKYNQRQILTILHVETCEGWYLSSEWHHPREYLQCEVSVTLYTQIKNLESEFEMTS